MLDVCSLEKFYFTRRVLWPVSLQNMLIIHNSYHTSFAQIEHEFCRFLPVSMLYWYWQTRNSFGMLPFLPRCVAFRSSKDKQLPSCTMLVCRKRWMSRVHFLARWNMYHQNDHQHCNRGFPIALKIVNWISQVNYNSNTASTVTVYLVDMEKYHLQVVHLWKPSPEKQ